MLFIAQVRLWPLSIPYLSLLASQATHWGHIYGSWGGVEPDMIPQLAKLMQTDMSSICRLVGISRSTVTRKLKTKATLSISQGAQVYGVVRALDAVLSLHRNNTTKTLSWLHRPAWGLGGAVPAQLLNTSMGVQAVIGLVGRIEHGVCQ